jgi:hypothetical protein
MRAIEALGTINTQGHIQLDTPQPQIASSRVRVIILLDEQIEAPPNFIPFQQRSQPRISGQDQDKVWLTDDSPQTLEQALQPLISRGAITMSRGDP